MTFFCIKRLSKCSKNVESIKSTTAILHVANEKLWAFCASGQESGMTSRTLFSCEFLMQGRSRGHSLSPIVPYEERNTGSSLGFETLPVLCRALNLGQCTGPPGCLDFRFFVFNPSKRDTLKMAGAIIENMSTKKLVIVGVILLLFQAFSFMVGGLIGE